MNVRPFRNGLQYDHGGAYAHLVLAELSRNQETANTIEQSITEMEVTTTLTTLFVDFANYEATPESKRRLTDPICRCIANLRNRNPNHPLLQLTFLGAKNVDLVDQFLVAAKQYGIQHVAVVNTSLTIQSLVKFCRDNTHLKVLDFFGTSIAVAVDASTVSQPQDSSAILALDELRMYDAFFENSAAATQFLNWLANVTYPALELGKIAVENDIDDASEEKKSARLHIVSELLKPSVERLTVMRGCHVENMDAMESCATVTEIKLGHHFQPIDFGPDGIQQKLQTIVTRNRELARFVANPQAYPHKKLLALMCQFDGCPTGRYMLACSIVGMPSIIKIKSTDSATTGPKTSTDWSLGCVWIGQYI